MFRIVVITFLVGLLWACSASLKTGQNAERFNTVEDSLRFWYSQPSAYWPKPFIDSGIHWRELGPLPASLINADSLRHEIELGRVLFFDPRLSASGQISCASCHNPKLSWTDGLAKSVGHEQRINRRNSPSLLNVWSHTSFFWDGRSPSLEDQAFGPINSESEMASDMPDVMRKLRKSTAYRALFDSAFHGEGINPETMTRALASFQRTLVSQPAAFDRFLAGDIEQLGNDALRGLHIFRTKARCMNCHNGPLFTDNSFHNTGIIQFRTETEDQGRFHATRKEADKGFFKTASLRDVTYTRPWMHNGLFDSLEEIVDMYNNGMRAAGAAEIPLDPALRKLSLTDREKKDLIAFLQAISAPPPAFELPRIPE